MAETLSYDNTPDTETLTEEEQDSLAVGEQLKEQQESLLAGKYKNAEDLESAYLELQKKLGESKEEVTEESEAEESEGNPYVDMLTSASQEYAEKGEMSKETFDSLKNMSSEDLLNAYVEMQKGNTPAPSVELNDSDITDLKASVGGDDSYNQITDWAAQSLSDAELDAFNATVESGTKAQIQMALAGLQARYQAENGYEGRQLQGKPPNNSRDVFRSQQQVVDAIADPRYDRDPGYRNEVLEKLERSDVSFR